MTQFCSDGHQPWRCGASAVTDSLGHYGVAVYDPDLYRLTVERSGYKTSGAVVRISRPGVTTIDRTLLLA
jgi:hypothetical protein